MYTSTLSQEPSDLILKEYVAMPRFSSMVDFQGTGEKSLTFSRKLDDILQNSKQRSTRSHISLKLSTDQKEEETNKLKTQIMKNVNEWIEQLKKGVEAIPDK